MSKNMSSIIFEAVSKTNRNKYNITKETMLKEDAYHMSPRFDRAQSFYGKAIIDEDNDGSITLISYGTPIVRVKDGQFEFLCGEDALTQTTMRHIRDFLKQMDYDNKIELSGKDYPITRRWVIEHLNNLNEEVTIDNPSENNDQELKDTLKDLASQYGSSQEVLDALRSLNTEKVISDEDYDKIVSNYDEWLGESAKVLTEAPGDELEDEELPIEEPVDDIPVEEPIEEPTEDEMTDAEVQDEAEEDKEDTIEDDIEQPFYATTPEFDELRDVLVDLDYRLFLINDNMVCIGRLNGPDIEFLTSNRPEDTDTEPSEQNDKAEEIEEKAEENNEDAYEYKWIKAPDTFDKFLNQVNVVYLSPEMSDEDREQYAGIEASHDSVMNFLMNELPEDKREEHEEEEIEDELPEEPIEAPIEDEFSEEPTEEPMPDETPDNEEEEEE